MHKSPGKLFKITARALFLAVLAAASATFADLPVISSGGMTPGGIEVSSASILPEDDPMAGTFLVRLLLRNTTAFEQDVACEAEAFSDGPGAITSSVRVPAGGTAILTLPLPPVNLSLYTLDLRDARGRVTFRPGSFRYSPPRPLSHPSSAKVGLIRFPDSSCAYLSKSVPYEAIQETVKACLARLHKAQRSAWRTYSTPYGQYFCAEGEEMRCVRASQVADPWPADWRAYLPYPLCIIADRDYPDIPEPAREALRRYTAAGGNVLFVGAVEPCLAIRREMFGDGLAALAANGSFDLGVSLHYGRGEARVLPLANLSSLQVEDLPDVTVDALVGAMRDAKCVFLAPLLGMPERNPNFLIDNARRLKVPAGLFISVLVLFVVLAGPVSMILLARRNRRIWILWLLPAISLAFTVTIVLAMLFSEGVRPYVTRDAFTLLSRDGRALTVGGVSVYAPLPVTRGLDFDRESDIAPVVHAAAGSIRYGRTLHYDGGWIATRSPALFAVRRFDILRERLEVFAAPDGGVEVVNALGAPIDRLTLWDADGRVYTAASIASGARVRLTPASRAPDEVVRRIKGVYNSHHGKMCQLDYDWREPEKPSYGGRGAPGFRCVYAAEIKGACPFLDDPLKGRRHHADDSAFVFGSFDPKTGGAVLSR